MAVQGISSYGGLYSPYPVHEIPKVSVAGVKEAEQQKQSPALMEEPGKTGNANLSSPAGSDTRERLANLEDISLTFHKEDTFDYIGSESSLAGLDMEKAVSDMQKDQVLQEYQYFVGSSEGLKGTLNLEDGMVFQK